MQPNTATPAPETTTRIRVEMRRVENGGPDSMIITGNLTGADIDAITTTIGAVDEKPISWISEAVDGVRVTTRFPCGLLCGTLCSRGATDFVLRKVGGTWTIVSRKP
jgi:hypothetical protein